MEANEIKERVSMTDVLAMYGIQPRNNMIHCPFGTHVDKNPSMKIFKDGFKCFACGESGDIFKFVQKIDRCSFKDAYLKLGGEYKYESLEEKKARKQQYKIDHLRREEERRQRKKERFNLLFNINLYQQGIDKLPPMSEEWCFCQNELEPNLHKLEELEKRWFA